jgi:hypothetical protein
MTTARRLCRLAGLIVVLAVAVPPGEGAAMDLNARQWGRTTHPFSDVGTASADLSRLCRLGKFNQRRIAETFIRYYGEAGRGLLGIAKQSYNLHDPTGASEPGKTYHFHNDGTSRCTVFVAP